jgi:hypothetical protein
MKKKIYNPELMAELQDIIDGLKKELHERYEYLENLKKERGLDIIEAKRAENRKLREEKQQQIEDDIKKLEVLNNELSIIIESSTGVNPFAN